MSVFLNFKMLFNRPQFSNQNFRTIVGDRLANRLIIFVNYVNRKSSGPKITARAVRITISGNRYTIARGSVCHRDIFVCRAGATVAGKGQRRLAWAREYHVSSATTVAITASDSFQNDLIGTAVARG